jgi:uncharacterized protein
MSAPPDRPLDALGLARSGAVIERNFPIAGFVRLRDRLAEGSGSASARVEFRERNGMPTAVLKVSAQVALVCQRGLGTVHRDLVSAACLAFTPEGTPNLPEDFEAIGGDPHRVELAALVEDELLLSLPLIAQHATGEACGLPAEAAGEPAAKAEEMRRPFAGLKDLLKH